MSYLKQLLDQKTKLKIIWAQRVALSKKDGTTIPVILRFTKKTVKNYRNLSGNLKITTLIIK